MAKHTVFISHSSKDEVFARSVAHALRSADVSAWIDDDMLISGDDILDVIGEGLGRMDTPILLISQWALESH